jgi:hypothetical protein
MNFLLKQLNLLFRNLIGKFVIIRCKTKWRGTAKSPDCYRNGKEAYDNLKQIQEDGLCQN